MDTLRTGSHAQGAEYGREHVEHWLGPEVAWLPLGTRGGGALPCHLGQGPTPVVLGTH